MRFLILVASLHPDCEFKYHACWRDPLSDFSDYVLISKFIHSTLFVWNLSWLMHYYIEISLEFVTLFKNNFKTHSNIIIEIIDFIFGIQDKLILILGVSYESLEWLYFVHIILFWTEQNQFFRFKILIWKNLNQIQPLINVHIKMLFTIHYSITNNVTTLNIIMFYYKWMQQWNIHLDAKFHVCTMRIKI